MVDEIHKPRHYEMPLLVAFHCHYSKYYMCRHSANVGHTRVCFFPDWLTIDPRDCTGRQATVQARYRPLAEDARSLLGLDHAHRFVGSASIAKPAPGYFARMLANESLWWCQVLELTRDRHQF